MSEGEERPCVHDQLQREEGGVFRPDVERTTEANQPTPTRTPPELGGVPNECLQLIHGTTLPSDLDVVFTGTRCTRGYICPTLNSANYTHAHAFVYQQSRDNSLI